MAIVRLPLRDKPRMDTPTQVFRYRLSFRLSLLLSAIASLAMALVALILPWTPAFRPVAPSPDVSAVLASALVFLPLAGYFVSRCNRYWGSLAVDPEGITIRRVTGRQRVRFRETFRVSVAGGEGAHELVLMAAGHPREIEIVTRHLEQEAKFLRIVKAGLSELIERQNKSWDEGEMTCEYSPRAQREGWYLAAIINGMAWVVAGSLIWRYYHDPMIITTMIAAMVAVLGLSVMIHQRHFSRRLVLTPQGLAFGSVLGNRFVSYFSVKSIAFRHRQGRGTRFIRCLLETPEGVWSLNSQMRNFDGFVSRLTRRCGQAVVRGGLAMGAMDRARIVRVRALSALVFWFAASAAVGMLLVWLGLSGLSERRRLLERGSVAAGIVTSKTRQDKNLVIRYRFTPMGEPDSIFYEGAIVVSEAVFNRLPIGGHIAVSFDPENPDRSTCAEDISLRFNWLFIAMGVVLFGYAGYQMRLIWLERQAARARDPLEA